MERNLQDSSCPRSENLRRNSIDLCDEFQPANLEHHVAAHAHNVVHHAHHVVHHAHHVAVHLLQLLHGLLFGRLRPKSLLNANLYSTLKKLRLTFLDTDSAKRVIDRLNEFHEQCCGSRSITQKLFILNTGI